MNISAGILELLKRDGKVAVPEFGVFSTENSTAILDADKNTILPPAKEIVFNADYHIQDDKLIDFLVSAKNSSRENIKSELKTQIDYWKNLLQNNNEFSVESLGKFSVSENKVAFKGNRIHTGSPDFYGLEEINISEIKSGKKIEYVDGADPKNDYKFNNSVWWIFLATIPILGLAYLGFTQQELLFGTKSFQDPSIKKAEQLLQDKRFKIDVEKLNATADNLKISDSLKQDSIINPATIPVKSSTKK